MDYCEKIEIRIITPKIYTGEMFNEDTHERMMVDTSNKYMEECIKGFYEEMESHKFYTKMWKVVAQMQKLQECQVNEDWRMVYRLCISLQDEIPLVIAMGKERPHGLNACVEESLDTCKASLWKSLSMAREQLWK